MARGRPAHLARRGAVYQVRFRLPTALAQRLGLAELRKSLHTSDPAEARRRCLSATAWFRDLPSASLSAARAKPTSLPFGRAGGEAEVEVRCLGSRKESK